MRSEAGGRCAAACLDVVHAQREKVGMQIADEMHAAGIGAELEQAAEVPLRRRQHEFLLDLVALPLAAQMGRQMTIRDEPRQGRLHQHRGLVVQRLLGGEERLDQVGGTTSVAEPNRREQELREACRHRSRGRHGRGSAPPARPAAIPPFAVVVVLEDPGIDPPRVVEQCQRRRASLIVVPSGYGVPERCI